MKFNFFKNMKATFLVSTLLVLFSLYTLNKSGLDYGIEFMGGTELVVSFKNDQSIKLSSASFEILQTFSTSEC